jgi:hypothetical protein
MTPDVDLGDGTTCASGTTSLRCGQQISLAGAADRPDGKRCDGQHRRGIYAEPDRHERGADPPAGWSTPAVQSRHAEIQNTVQSRGASTVITLKDASAPRRYDFALKLAPGGSTHLAPDGSVIVSDQQGNVIGSFARPWAKDATGKNLATEYVLTGSTMTQIVKTDGAQFPVTADPRYTWGWVTGTIYFNKNETKKFAVGVGVAAFIATFSGPWAPLMRGYAAYIGAVAGWAVADGKCVAFKSTLVAYEYGASQGGGYCR